MAKEISLVILVVAIIVVFGYVETQSPLAIYYMHPNFDIYQSGHYTIAKTNGTTVYMSTSSIDVFNYTMQSNNFVIIHRGIYNFSQSSVIRLNGIENLTVLGETNLAKIIKTDIGGNYSESGILSIYGNSKNITFKDVIFDGGKGQNSVYDGQKGLQYLIFLGESEQITFDGCKIKNAVDCGIVGASNDLLITQCEFNTIGEHPIYLSNHHENITIEKTNIYNWAKTEGIRGYGIKILNCSDITIRNVVLDANKDHLGIGDEEIDHSCIFVFEDNATYINVYDTNYVNYNLVSKINDDWLIPPYIPYSNVTTNCFINLTAISGD